MKQYREQYYQGHTFRSVMPSPESIYDKKQLFKLYQQYININPIRKVRKMTIND